ncbi:MAG: tyrosine-type recombinase/integrase [Pseudonocardiaceae bacterium]
MGTRGWGVAVVRSGRVPGGAPALFVAGGTALLHAEEQTFETMLGGWRDQQLSRNLRAATVRARLLAVCRFQRFTNDWPWTWRAVDVEEFTADLRTGARTVATVRAYQGALRQFLDYVCDPRYEWSAACERLFGTHPVQVCFEWNTAVHVADHEGRPGRRALTKPELQRLFDHADDQVAAARASGHKGWLTALRDSAALKCAYGWGLRRHELAMLEVVDFGTNPRAPEFGEYGVLHVRYGKASKGSAPKRRSVLTVFPWSVRVITEWLDGYRELFDTATADGSLWPTERTARLADGALSARFAQYRDAAGLPPELGLHCLRHSYVTHLIEAGYDPLFVQQQVGHSYASTLALYTSVSADYRARTLRAVLDKTVSAALGTAASTLPAPPVKPPPRKGS